MPPLRFRNEDGFVLISGVDIVDVLSSIPVLHDFPVNNYSAEFGDRLRHGQFSLPDLQCYVTQLTDLSMDAFNACKKNKR